MNQSLASADDTHELGQDLLLQHYTDQRVFFITGPLGVGKTVLVSGMLKAWGHGELATSPSFSLLIYYEQKGKYFFHADLYRLRNPHELSDLDLPSLYHKQNLLVVEWADRFPSLWGEFPHIVHITLSITSDGRRAADIQQMGYAKRG